MNGGLSRRNTFRQEIVSEIAYIHHHRRLRIDAVRRSCISRRMDGGTLISANLAIKNVAAHQTAIGESTQREILSQLSTPVRRREADLVPLRPHSSSHAAKARSAQKEHILLQKVSRASSQQTVLQRIDKSLILRPLTHKTRLNDKPNYFKISRRLNLRNIRYRARTASKKSRQVWQVHHKGDAMTEGLKEWWTNVLGHSSLKRHLKHFTSSYRSLMLQIDT